MRDLLHNWFRENAGECCDLLKAGLIASDSPWLAGQANPCIPDVWVLAFAAE